MWGNTLVFPHYLIINISKNIKLILPKSLIVPDLCF